MGNNDIHSIRDSYIKRGDASKKAASPLIFIILSIFYKSYFTVNITYRG